MERVGRSPWLLQGRTGRASTWRRCRKSCGEACRRPWADGNRASTPPSRALRPPLRRRAMPAFPFGEKLCPGPQSGRHHNIVAGKTIRAFPSGLGLILELARRLPPETGVSWHPERGGQRTHFVKIGGPGVHSNQNIQSHLKTFHSYCEISNRSFKRFVPCEQNVANVPRTSSLGNC